MKMNTFPVFLKLCKMYIFVQQFRVSYFLFLQQGGGGGVDSLISLKK
jgi:hypothetical protein